LEGKSTKKATKKAAKAEKAERGAEASSSEDGQKHLLNAMLDAQQTEMKCRQQLKQGILEHGTDHIEVCRRAARLADLCYHTGRSGEAEPLLRQALEISEKHEELGPDHIETAKLVNNLGNCLRKLGKSAEAKPLLERALASSTKLFGRDHPNTDTARANLVELLDKQGHAIAHVAALSLLEQALKEEEAAQDGPSKQPRIAAALRGLSLMQAKTGNKQLAEDSLARALGICESVFGNAHPSTGSTLAAYAHFLRSQNKMAEAAPQYQRLLEMTKNALGPHHPQYGIALKALAQVQLALKQNAEAVKNATEACAIMRKVHGGVHVAMADCLDTLAQCEEAVGNTEAAVAHREEGAGVRAKATQAAEAAKNANVDNKVAQEKIMDACKARQAQKLAVTRQVGQNEVDMSALPAGMEVPPPLLNSVQERLRKKLEAKGVPATNATK